MPNLTRNTWLVVVAAGAVALIAGAILALTSISRDGYTCGNLIHAKAYSPVNAGTASLLLAGRVQSDCDAAISDRRALAYPLLAVGALGLLVGFVKANEQAPTSDA